MVDAQPLRLLELVVAIMGYCVIECKTVRLSIGSMDITSNSFSVCLGAW